MVLLLYYIIFYPVKYKYKQFRNWLENPGLSPYRPRYHPPQPGVMKVTDRGKEGSIYTNFPPVGKCRTGRALAM
jgi:hypothetical protein